MTQLPVDPAVANPGRSTPSPPGPFDHRSEPPPRVTWRNVVVLASVSAGGVVGACSRDLVDQVLPPSAAGYPWSTLLVNVSGAFVLALLLIFMLDVWPPTRYVRPFLAIGVLGSYTTFGSVMVDVDQMFSRGAALLAASYLVSSMITSLLAGGAGLIIGRRFVSRRERRGQEAAG
jgi:CrcB protein